jgi:predicted nucleic acid-binding protein
MGDGIPVAIADTSGLIAFFNSADRHHAEVRAGVAQVGHLVVSPCVLAELDYLVVSRQGPPEANRIIRYIAGRVAAGRWEVPDVGTLLLAAHSVLGDYPDVRLTDALNVVLAREFRTDVIATFDNRHFRVIRPLSPHAAFRLLPADTTS